MSSCLALRLLRAFNGMKLGTPTRCTRTQQIGSSARVCVCVRDRVLESFELFFPICKLSLIVSFVFLSLSLSPPLQMACRKTARRVGGTKKRAQRATSNVFAMFDQDQIQEFKEAFNMIDQNRDGFIDHDDLKDMLASLGKVRVTPLDISLDFFCKSL